jgi:hypothetical protein
VFYQGKKAIDYKADFFFFDLAHVRLPAAAAVALPDFGNSVAGRAFAGST